MRCPDIRVKFYTDAQGHTWWHGRILGLYWGAGQWQASIGRPSWMLTVGWPPEWPSRVEIENGTRYAFGLISLRMDSP